MKRAISAIAATIATLYLVLGFKATPPPETVADSSNAEPDTSTSEPETTPDTAPDTTTTEVPPQTQSESPTTAATTTTTVATTTTQPPRKSFSGDVETTDWGNVQVTITVQGTKIIAVSAQLPNYAPDTMARPKLISETLKSQSANVAVVSGATLTSGAWRLSLASAIQKAHI